MVHPPCEASQSRLDRRHTRSGERSAAARRRETTDLSAAAMLTPASVPNDRAATPPNVNFASGRSRRSGCHDMAVLGAGAGYSSRPVCHAQCAAAATGCWIGTRGPARIGRHARVRWIRRCGRRPRSGVLIVGSGARPETPLPGLRSHELAAPCGPGWRHGARYRRPSRRVDSDSVQRRSRAARALERQRTDRHIGSYAAEVACDQSPSDVVRTHRTTMDAAGEGPCWRRTRRPGR